MLMYVPVSRNCVARRGPCPYCNSGVLQCSCTIHLLLMTPDSTARVENHSALCSCLGQHGLTLFITDMLSMSDVRRQFQGFQGLLMLGALCKVGSCIAVKE